MKKFSTHIERILVKTCQVQTLFEKYPEFFDFSTLNDYEKFELIRYDPDTFALLLGVNSLSLEHRVCLAISANKKVRDLAKLTEKDLESASFSDYLKLLNSGFDKFIRKKIYERLNRRQQIEISFMNPQWVLDNYKDFPKFSRNDLREIVYGHEHVLEHITDFSQFSTDAEIWLRLIEKNKKYRDVFLDNMHTCVTCTDVRRVIESYPEMIRKLTVEHFSNGKLSHKQWALFISHVSKERKNKKYFEDWSLPAELVEDLKLGTTMEVMSGKSRASTRLSGSLAKISPTEKQDADTCENCQE